MKTACAVIGTLSALACARNAMVAFGGNQGRIATTTDGLSYTTIATCGANVLNLAFDTSAEALFAIVGSNKVIRVNVGSPEPSQCGTAIATLSSAGADLRRITADGAGQYVFVTQGNSNLGEDQQQGGVLRISQSGQGQTVSMFGDAPVTGGPNGISFLPKNASSSPQDASNAGTIYFSTNGNSTTTTTTRVQGIMSGNATAGSNATVEFSYSQSQDWWPDGIVLNGDRSGGFFFEHRYRNGGAEGAVQSFQLPGVSSLNALVTGLQIQEADRPGLAYDPDQRYFWITLPSSESGSSGVPAGRIMFTPDQRGGDRTEIPLPSAVRDTFGKAMSVTFLPKTQAGENFDYTSAATCCSGSDDDDVVNDDTAGGDDDVVNDDTAGGDDDGALASARVGAGALVLASLVACATSAGVA